MYFRKYQLPKTWLDKSLKSRVSEDPQTENMAKWWKQRSNLNDYTFTKLINHCEGNCIGKSLLIHRILRQFVNTLTVDEKHYLLNRDN